jgi:hypothetical protein
VKITTAALKEPFNMVFRIWGDRKWKKDGEERVSRGNMYFHLDWACILKIFPEARPENISIEKKTLDALTDDNMQVLHNLDYLAKAIQNVE